MPDYGAHYHELVIALAKEHAHENAKRRAVVIEQKLADGLDGDDVRELMREAATELRFVNFRSGRIWLDQNEALLQFVRDDTDEDLQFISVHFDHLVPPSLREKYDLPPPTF